MTAGPTLVSLMIAVAIIGILASVVIPLLAPEPEPEPPAAVETPEAPP